MLQTYILHFRSSRENVLAEALQSFHAYLCATKSAMAIGGMHFNEEHMWQIF